MEAAKTLMTERTIDILSAFISVRFFTFHL